MIEGPRPQSRPKSNLENPEPGFRFQLGRERGVDNSIEAFLRIFVSYDLHVCLRSLGPFYIIIAI